MPATPLIGEIRSFAGNFPPRGWALCDGQLLTISSNTALFSILGTTYGGDGRVTFGLPDLRGRVPIHVGSGAGLSPKSLGQQGGAENHTLTSLEIPNHTHSIPADSDPGTEVGPTSSNPAYPAEALLAGRAVTKYNTTSDGVMATSSTEGGNQPHNNMQPSLAINFIIALQGVFPSRN